MPVEPPGCQFPLHIQSSRCSSFLLKEEGSNWEFPDDAEKQVCDSTLDLELFHRKGELAASLRQELWALGGGQAPDSQCNFKRSFKSQTKPMRISEDYYILGCRVATAGMSCVWVFPDHVSSRGNKLLFLKSGFPAMVIGK